jgi:hypothetical protein
VSRKRIDGAGVTTLALTRLATWLKPRTVCLGAAGGDVDIAVDAFDAWCAEHPGAVCELALSSRWVICCVPPLGAGAMTALELRRYAQRQIAHYLDDARESDDPRWAIAVSQRPNAHVACGAPGELIDRLKSAAKVHRVSIQRIFPWWLAAASPSPESPGRVVVAEPGIVTALHFLQGRLHRVETDFDADQVEPGALILWSESDPMPVVCDAASVVEAVGTRPSRRRSIDLDLLGTPPRAAWSSWALLLVAVICALGEARREDGLLSAQAREQALLERVQSSHARVRSTAGASVLPPNIGAVADIRTLEAAADMLALQQHPWGDIFTGVEVASGHVAILNLQHDASRPAVDVEVAVSNDETAWGFAERMSADSAHFASATLLTRQPLEPPVGTLTGRARVQAVLAAAPANVPRNLP